MTRTRRFLGGLSWGYANQIVTTLVGLWLTRFLIDRLGESDYGLWLVATQILAYLLLLDLGVVALLPREVAFATGRPTANGDLDPAAVSAVVGRTTRLVWWQLPAVGAIAVGLWFALPQMWAPLRTPLLWVFLAFVLSFPARILQGLLEGLQDLAFLGVAGMTRWTVVTVVTVGLVLRGHGLIALAIGWIAGQVTSTGLWWARLRHRWPNIRPLRLARFDRGALRDRLQRSGWASLAQAAQVFLSGTELLIVGRMIGPEAVVLYFCTAKLVAVLAHQPKLLAQTAGPALSELRAAASPAHIRSVADALTLSVLLTSGAIVCAVVAGNEGFVVWWVGPERFGGVAFTSILAVTMLLRHINTTAVYTIFAFGRDRRISVTTLVDGIVTVALSIGLVAWLGPIGAAWGTLGGVVLVSLPLNLRAVWSETGVTGFEWARGMWPWAWRFALLALLATAVAWVWAPSGLLASGAAAGMLIALYGILMYPLLTRPPLDRYVVPRWRTLRNRFARDPRAS